MNYFEGMRADIQELIDDYGLTCNITTYDYSSEDVWGKTDTTGNPSTAQVFIVDKGRNKRYVREGVKSYEYMVFIAKYSCNLDVGDEIEYSSRTYRVELVTTPEFEDQAIFKRYEAVSEEYR